jgi:tetratricopeptide (TPR) repeat protein
MPDQPDDRGAAPADDPLSLARAAAGRGDWPEAYERLKAAEEDGALPVAELPFLAQVAYAAGHLDVTIATWERAHGELARSGNAQAAAGAAVRVAMHLLFDTALMAPVRGWLSRAERLLEGHAPAPPLAWLSVVRSYERLLSGDLAAAREWAGRAIEVGSGCDAAAAALGRVAAARSVILDARVSDGLALLDEAGAAALSGEIDPMSTGVIYCELVCALQALAQYDLAEQWTAAMERWAETAAIGSLRGRCRVHRAEILRLRGASSEAEEEALRACDELRPYLQRELGWPLCELGRIRLRRGDLAGAEAAFLAAHESGWDPYPGLALVLAAQGHVADASLALRDALDHPLNVPSKELPPNTELRRAPLLEAQVEVELAAGALDVARQAANELEAIAARFESKALSAAASVARGRVLLDEGKIADARRHLAQAVRLWTAIGAPYETGVARLELSRAYKLEGHDMLAQQELHAARSLFERAGAELLTEDAAQKIATDAPSPGVEGVPPSNDAATFRRDGDGWLIAFSGRSVRLKDRKGLRYLARLLATAGQEHHVLALVAEESGSAGTEQEHELGPGDSGVMLDAHAKETYRRRLVEIDEDLAEAEAMGDAGRVEQARRERDFLQRELSRALGLGGRDRSAGVASERARASITRAIRQAMALIDEHHSALAAHLGRAIRTGTYCAYLPDPQAHVRWMTE